MRKILCTALAAFIVLTATAFGLAELKGYSYPFIGKWMPAEHPMLVDDFGFQDIQNMRKDGKHIKTVLGHTSLNATALTTNTHILNGFHFRKDQPQESHVIVYAANSFTPATAVLRQNTTAIPGTGNFTTTALYTNGSVTDIGRFSMAPQGNMIYANGDVTYIWGGNEINPTSVITSSATVTYTVTDSIDLTGIVTSSASDASSVVTLSYSSIDTYTKLLLHFDGTDGATSTTDAAGLTVSMASGAQIDTGQFKWTSSAQLDGSNDFVVVNDSDAFFTFTDNLTIDFWVRFNSVAQNNAFFSQHDATGGTTTFYAYWNQASGKILLVAITAGTTVGSYEWSWSPSTSTWYHVAFIRNGATFDCYINGVALSKTETTAIGANQIVNIIANFDVGRAYPGSYVYLNGWIDEFRFSNGIARWTANFSPPQSPYGIGSNHILVGFTRPLQGVKFYVKDANTATSTMTGEEWNGASWTSLTLTDGTASGGKTLAQTGTVSWTYTGNGKPRYINGLSLYWYQFHFSAGQAGIYYMTVDAPMQEIRNIWNGAYDYPVKVLKWNGTTYVDYTDDVVDEDPNNTYADLSSLTTSQYLLAGFVNRQQGLDIQTVITSENSTASTTMTVQYWNGTEWTTANASNDGTATGTISLSKPGVVTWQGNDGTAEALRTISDETPLYYYKLSFGASLDADTKVGEIRGIGYPDPMKTYKFSVEFQNRAFLCNQKYGQKNKCVYSNANAPDIFNGSDYGELIFGDLTELTGSVVLYNVFRTTGYDQLIVTKKNETYRVTGDGPDNWISQKMSGNIGCVAPLSMVTTEAVRMSEDMYRNVAIWVSDKGVVASDGAVINYISDDIKHYWNAINSAFIPVNMQSRSVGWYDPLLNSYKLLIASGAGATFLNTELEYNLKTKEWTKIYRANATGANPIQSGWQVFDTNGLGYTYGGGKDGYMYRLENGYTWAGQPIASYVWTKDILLGGDMLLNTTPVYFRLAYKTKTATTGEEINIAHYGDAVLTTSGSNGKYVPAAMSMASGPYRTSDCVLGPHQMHSFKITATTSTVYNGMELLGMSLFYDPSKTIAQ